MDHDVFVSYSNKDKAVADTIVAAMEKNGIRCWYAPRDIKPGDDWGMGITTAIEKCRVFLVIFSTNANRSQRVLDEVNLAITQQATIVPFRIEDLEPDGAMKLHLSSRHWLDAYNPSWEPFLEKLIKNIATIIDSNFDDNNIQIPEYKGKDSKDRRRKKALLIVAVVLIGALLLPGVWFVYKSLNPPIQNEGITSETPTIENTKNVVITEKSEDNVEYTYSDLVLCYPSFGTDHMYYIMGKASVIQSAKDKGIKQLVISDAQKDQEMQLSATRSCIQQGADVIAIPMIEDYGWVDVLAEAKDADISVIIIKEESIYVDQSLYDVQLMVDNFLQGQKSGEEMNKLLPDGGNIVELSGPGGYEHAKKRSSGFRDVLDNNINILDSQPGNWTREDAFPVVKEFLKKFAGQIDGIYIQNDGMALGAIDALKAAGIAPGEIKIISIDGTNEAFQAMIDGWIQAEVETNPLFGPQLLEIALDLMNGKDIAHEIPITQNVYYPDEAEDLLLTRLW